MPADDDALDPLDDAVTFDDPEAEIADAGMEQLLAEFEGRSKGLSGQGLERELDHLIERIVERDVGAAPPAMRDDLRQMIRS